MQSLDEAVADDCGLAGRTVYVTSEGKLGCLVVYDSEHNGNDLVTSSQPPAAEPSPRTRTASRRPRRAGNACSGSSTNVPNCPNTHSISDSGGLARRGGHNAITIFPKWAALSMYRNASGVWSKGNTRSMKGCILCIAIAWFIVSNI